MKTPPPKVLRPLSSNSALARAVTNQRDCGNKVRLDFGLPAIRPEEPLDREQHAGHFRHRVVSASEVQRASRFSLRGKSAGQEPARLEVDVQGAARYVDRAAILVARRAGPGRPDRKRRASLTYVLLILATVLLPQSYSPVSIVVDSQT